MKTMLCATLVSLIFTVPVLADQHKGKEQGNPAKNRHTVSECNQWANQRGLKGQERQQYVDRCINKGGVNKDWDKDRDGDKERDRKKEQSADRDRDQRGAPQGRDVPGKGGN
jgi:hypothetical protein